MQIIYRFFDDRHTIKNLSDVAKTKPYGPSSEYGVIGSKEWWRNVDSGALRKHTARGVVRGLWFGQYHGGPAEFQMELPDGKLFGGLCYREPEEADEAFTLGRICEVDYVTVDAKTIDDHVNSLEIWLELRLGESSLIPVMPLPHTEQNFGRFSRIKHKQLACPDYEKQRNEGLCCEYLREKVTLDFSRNVSSMKSLAEIKLEVEKLAGVIKASIGELPTYGYSADGGRTHIEVSDLEYHYVSVERGQELSRVSTADFDEVLFRIFSDVTFHLAVEFELENRIEIQDCRRIIFDHQIQMLSALSSVWADRESIHHAKILESCPFDDFAGYYASRIANYLEVGLTYGAACKLAALVTKKAKLIASFKRIMKRIPK